MAVLVHEAVTLLSYLTAHPRSRIQDIQHDLDAHHGGRAHRAAAVIYYIRNIVGHDVVVCDRGTNVYYLAVTRDEGKQYVERRKTKVRNETENLVGICDRIEARWPGDPSIAALRQALVDAANLLNHTP